MALLCIMRVSLAAGQLRTAVACDQSRQADTASVPGYVLKTYEEPNLKDDLGCFEILDKGKSVYRLSVEYKYFIGQQQDKEFNIPAISISEDLTGDGRPDVIVTSWSGGTHCCYTKYVLELKPRLRLLAKIEDGDTDIGHFEKLDGDTVYHYVTYDIWSYWPDSFEGSVSHKVLLKWDGKEFQLDLQKMKFPAPTPQQWEDWIASPRAST